MEDSILKFIWNFFKNLEATLSVRNEIITVSNVPEKFEKFLGKKSPYKFTTKKELETDEIEFLEKGSYVLKAISDYLENSAETTLLKINLKYNGESEIKKRLELGNSIISAMSPRKKNNIFFRFTFHTSLQYLNEREKIINEIYVHENNVVNGNLNDYPVIEGTKSEIRIPDMKEAYFIAKEELKERLKDKTKETSEKLNHILTREINRIEKHFETEEKELKSQSEKAREKLEELKSEGDESKIKRQTKFITNIKERLNPEERLNDKERTIMIEKTKHNLNVNNKLFNTTLIYYPLASFDTTIKNGNVKKKFETIYDPLTKTIHPTNCSVCNKEMEKIYLCNNEHLACRDCMGLCASCGKEYCKNCLTKKCELCGKNICNTCAVRCAKCGKLMCKSHTTQDKISKRHYCNSCLTRCERCGTLKIGTDFRKSRKTGVKICEDCYRKEIQDSIVRSLD